MQAAIRASGISVEDIDYVNGHGTGTHANDTAERLAFKAVFHDRVPEVALSSIKGAIGHCLGAAGGEECVASVMALNNGMVPPTVNFDPDFDPAPFDLVPNKAEKRDCRVILSNSFAFGGNNCCLSLGKPGFTGSAPEPADDSVVITGMGVISPVGNSLPAFWDSLKGGVCGVGPITKFDTADFKVKVAAEVKDFNAADFGMDVPTQRRMDLFTQYAMAAAKQAVEDSGILGAVDPERFGVYVGSGIGGMNTFIEQNNRLNQRGPTRVSALFIPMMIANMAAGSIAIKYDAQGPCLPTVTACATSTHAAGEAYRAIAHGYADAIIAGGAEATINPLAVAGFTTCMALSLETDPLKASLPFDARRAGFVMGEGSGILVLEEYEHAKARGAKIYAEVAGYGNTCDAHHVTAPRPDGSGGARAMKQALEQANYTAGKDSLYINAHGTGTKLNDSSETTAIKLALGEEDAKRARISSTKSMTGHMLGAAGAVELIASALALQNGVIPPTIGLEQPDPDCDLNYTPLAAQEAQADVAVSLSLGFGGHNGAVALRRAED